jgi:putative ABC transport system permease protein
MGRKRLIAGLVLVLGGISCAVTTATVLDAGVLQSQSVAAEGAILSSLGLALLAPMILNPAAALLAPVLGALGGAPAQLGIVGIWQRLHRAATPLMPVIVCTAIASGTLSMLGTWNAGHHASLPDSKNTATLNYVVVGMLAVFAPSCSSTCWWRI